MIGPVSGLLFVDLVARLTYWCTVDIPHLPGRRPVTKEQATP
jgi:hypothetical protein